MNLFIYPVLLSWMNKELHPDCAQPGGAERGREQEREGKRGREERGGGARWAQSIMALKREAWSSRECWGGLNDHYCDSRKHMHSLTLCLSEQKIIPTHTHTLPTSAPRGPDLTLYLHTHLHSLLPPLWSWQVLRRYITPRSSSLRAVGPGCPFTAGLVSVFIQ